MATGSRALFRFGDIELDVGAYELRRGGRAIRLEQQPMDLLILLVERRPQLVTRGEIIERLWGPETFVEADAGINTAIRKIRQALRDRAASPRFIERVPGKGYRFSGRVHVERITSDLPAPPRPSSEEVARSVSQLVAPAAPYQIDPARHTRLASEPIPRERSRHRGRVGTLSAVGLIAAAGVGALFFNALSRTAAGPLKVVPLTRLAGVEREPTFSPDGSQVAFAWDGELQDNFDIYVTLADGEGLRRLTTDPAADLAPQWSPDGRQIAYVRVQPPGRWHQLRVISAVGGSDRAVSDFPAWYQSSWSPDGRHLAAGRAVLPGVPSASNGIYLVPLNGGEPRALTRPASGSDYSPAFSRDGRRLAYASCRDTTFRFNCDVEVLTLDERLQPSGSPRRLTRETQGRISGITWSRDGAFVVYGAGVPTSHLWRVSADGSSAPERIEEAGEGAAYPAWARSDDRVAFSRAFSSNHVYRFAPGRRAEPVAQSAGQDVQPDFSPDGRRFAFCSDRSGFVEVWVVAADGSAPQQVTRGPGSGQCSPAWSPDGRRIAFDSVGTDGFMQIWTIAVDGGIPRQITKDPADHNVPRWSRDGQWIYFSSTRGGSRNIWRAHVETGLMEQMTKTGSGFSSHESADEAGILYPASNADSPLLFQSYAGGAAQAVIPCVAAGSTVAVGPRGIYYLPCQREKLATEQPIHVFDPATGEDQLLGMFEGYYRRRDSYTPSFRKMTLSPDGGGILYSRRLPAVGDLFLIENFR